MGLIGPSSFKKIGGQRGNRTPHSQRRLIYSHRRANGERDTIFLAFQQSVSGRRPFPRRVSCPFCSARGREVDPLLRVTSETLSRPLPHADARSQLAGKNST